MRGALCLAALAVMLLFSGWGVPAIARADGPFDPPGVGYLDFTYAVASGAIVDAPTGEKPESKLWWNDGFWWGSLYNRSTDRYQIYRLNWGTQIWEDTGIALDDRRTSKADAMWDEASGKLYVASHAFTTTSTEIASSADWGRLYRYSYSAAAQTYSLDSGFPVTVNRDKTETLVVAKDSTGRLWVTYVSKALGSQDYRVYANTSTDAGLTWGTPFVLPVASTTVHNDDIASVIAFRDDTGDRIGVMWSNQLSGALNFAVHDDSVGSPTLGWTNFSIAVPGGSDDHVSIKSLRTTSSGQVFAAVKTSALSPATALIGMVARDTDGTFSFHTYSTVADDDTRPILLVDEDNSSVTIFVAGRVLGSKICYKSLAITSPLSSMGDFPAGDCGTAFIEDSTYNKINNPTSFKRNVSSATGLVVMASDDSNGRFYVHNVLGNPPPVVTARGPQPDATQVALSAVVTATFSKPMNSSTLNSSTFTVQNSGGQVAGSISYDNTTRTVTFTPASLLNANTVYTVTLSGGVQDASGQPLFGAPEVWRFTTEPPTVQFSAGSFSVGESAGTATISVTLSAPSGKSVSVSYATSDGSASAGADYSPASGSLTFNPGQTARSFSVTILPDALDEPDETLNLALSGPTNAGLGTPTAAILTITDDDYSVYLPILGRNP